MHFIKCFLLAYKAYRQSLKGDYPRPVILTPRDDYKVTEIRWNTPTMWFHWKAK